MEYGSHTKKHHFKHQRELLSSAEGQPIVVLDCYTDGDVVGVAGTYHEVTSHDTIAVITPKETVEYPLDQRVEVLVGFEDIDEFVESALESYENNNDTRAGVAAISLIDKFPEHFPALPSTFIETVAKAICRCDEYDDYLEAIHASSAMEAQVDTIMGNYIRRFDDIRDALKSAKVTAYLEAKTDPVDSDAQFGLLLACRPQKNTATHVY